MRQTAPRMGGTTQDGMRRILKRRPHVMDYMRQAVETGVYQNNDSRANDRRNNRNQQQQGQGGFGEGVPSYPDMYKLMVLNPPIPPMAKPPKDVQKAQSKMYLPTDRLIRSYLRRHDERMRASHPLTEAQKEEARYAKLLGLSVPDPTAAMGRKATVLSNAYTFALKQYEILRTDEARGGDMTQEESVQVVEQLLAEEAARERERSRETAQEAAQWREARRSAEAAEKSIASEGEAAADMEQPPLTNDDDIEPPSADEDGIAPTTEPSILTGKPRTLSAMKKWAQRLEAVPYNRWTVGAAAALDHWIAVDVLGLSEESWEKILAGDDGEDDEVMTGRGEDGTGIGVGSTARARDIVAVRMALFPETVMYGEDDQKDEAVDGGVEELDEEAKEAAKTQKSIDDLLASLSGLGGDEVDDEWNFDTKDDDAQAEVTPAYDAELDERIAEMIDTLQEWRAKSAEAPYKEWNDDDRAEFDEWLTEYIDLVTTEADGKVDIAATREALLSEPPMKRDESDAFWSNIRDETQVEIFLAGLKTKAATESDEALAAFLQLPHDVQVRKLVDIGTLRPLFDEYTPESVRVSFLRRYAGALLEGTELEHLVPDPKGPITSDDLGNDPDLLGDAEKGKRFRVEMVKYGTDEFGTSQSQRARELYRAWCEHKAGRAKYEEALFKKGKIGLEQKTKK